MIASRVLIGFLLAAFVADAAADFEAGLRAYRNAHYAEARREWLPLALEGDARAQYFLGQMYSGSEGVPLDHAEAARWYRKAAGRGHAIAQCRLGDLYDRGLGVARDVAQAFAWYLKGAENGSLQAQYKLGFFFAGGRGTPRDEVQAYKWWAIAAAWGDPDAAEERDRLAARMDPAALARARALARDRGGGPFEWR